MVMDYQAIAVSHLGDGLYSIRLSRPGSRNSLSAVLVSELLAALGRLEALDGCKAIVLEGTGGYFCTGMNFQAFVDGEAAGGSADSGAPPSADFMQLLKRLGNLSRMVIAKTDGQVLAGGIGLMAACDYVIATPRSTFALPEAIWGLVPALVSPYLIRRTGYWQAYKMTLTTLPLSAEEALGCRLADEVTDTPDAAVQRLYRRISRISPQTVREIKGYFREMWIINERMEKAAVAEIDKLTASPEVRENIQNYVRYQRFPWEKE
ncbi:enoyl-CoA hydratase-related protein [Paenibacillus sp. FSL R7-0179]|uniref:enoyl-CoA hydratase-related protein n=1 Tax=Paenibacillus sp. FSL R7-0179 TaxID=2921672 RepID=UPI0030FB7F79